MGQITIEAPLDVWVSVCSKCKCVAHAALVQQDVEGTCEYCEVSGGETAGRRVAVPYRVDAADQMTWNASKNGDHTVNVPSVPAATSQPSQPSPSKQHALVVAIATSDLPDVAIMQAFLAAMTTRSPGMRVRIKFDQIRKPRMPKAKSGSRRA